MGTARSIAVKVLLAAVVLYFAIYVWPTPYKEYQYPDRSLIIRINRVTGSQQVHTLHGWEDVE